MNISTYRIESELEFHRIISALDELKIPYTIFKHTDTSFPVLGQTKSYADISVPKEFEKDTESIIKNTIQKEPTKVNYNTTSSSKKRKIWQIALIGYSILITVLFFKYWYVYKKSSEDKNFKFEWSLDNTDLILKYKKTGNNAHLYTDANFDMNYEQSMSYSLDGYRVLESYDRNEDGIFEESYFFNLNGDLTSKNFDNNNDGIVERMEIVLENRDTLKLVDTNGNGYLEIGK
jgi:hypothetical protein